MNRRKFFSKLGMQVGGIALASPLYRTFFVSPGTQAERLLAGVASAGPTGIAPSQYGRYLININCPMAWDSIWMHNSTLSSPLLALPSVTNVVKLTGAISGLTYTPRFADALGLSNYIGTNDPSSSNPHFFGQDFVGIFGGGSAPQAASFLKNNLAVLKGLVFGGGHAIGNNFNNMGSTSSYAKSYSAITAGYLAANDHARPLHYMCVANGPIYSTINLNQGAEIPMCVGDVATFQSLTQPPYFGIDNPTSPVDKTSSASVAGIPSSEEAALISQTTIGLAQGSYAGQLQLQNSRAALSNFNTGMTARMAIQTSHWAASIEFNCVRLRYAACIDRAWAALYGGAPPFGADALYQGLASTILSYRLGQGDIAAAEAKISAAFATAAGGAGIEAQIISVNNNAYNTFGPAFADFLIRRDLSAVVDLSLGLVDSHAGSATGSSNRQYTYFAFALYRELIASLMEVDVGGGQSLFDRTLLVIQSEMDRNFWNNANSSAGTFYTDHDLGVTSCMMAGYGIRRGAVGGGTLGAGEISSGAFAGAAGIGGPLPVNMNTGVIQPLNLGGGFIGAGSLLPTIVTAMGAPIPGRQITDAGPLGFIIKS